MEVDLGATLDDALENLDTAIAESGAEIVRPRQPLPRIMGDPTLLTMVWQNLIGNAVKFRRDGVAAAHRHRLRARARTSPTARGC